MLFFLTLQNCRKARQLITRIGALFRSGEGLVPIHKNHHFEIELYGLLLCVLPSARKAIVTFIKCATFFDMLHLFQILPNMLPLVQLKSNIK